MQRPEHLHGILFPSLERIPRIAPARGLGAAAKIAVSMFGHVYEEVEGSGWSTSGAEGPGNRQKLRGKYLEKSSYVQTWDHLMSRRRLSEAEREESKLRRLGLRTTPLQIVGFGL